MQFLYYKSAKKTQNSQKVPKCSQLSAFEREFRKILKDFAEYDFETVKGQLIALPSKLFEKMEASFH